MRKSLLFILVSVTMLLADNAKLWKSPANLNSVELRQVMKTLASAQKIEGSFTQTRTVPKINRTFESSGTFTLSATEGIALNAEKPFPSKLEISETKIVQTSADGAKTEMSATDNVIFREIASSMHAVLAGDLSVLQKRFDVYFVKGEKIWNVGLLPKEKTIRKAIASISLEGNATLEKMKLVDGEGNILTYEFRESAK